MAQVKDPAQGEMPFRIPFVKGDGVAARRVTRIKNSLWVIAVAVHVGIIEGMGQARIGGCELRRLVDGAAKQALPLGVVGRAEAVKMP